MTDPANNDFSSLYEVLLFLHLRRPRPDFAPQCRLILYAFFYFMVLPTPPLSIPSLLYLADLAFSLHVRPPNPQDTPALPSS